VKRNKWSEWKNETLAGIDIFTKALWQSGLPRVVVLLTTALATGALAIWLVEGDRESFASYWQSVWWAVVSMTSTGYGDIVPVTPLGRVVGSLVILSGVVLISFFTATISSLFIAAKIREGKGLEQVHYHDHLVICGDGLLTRRVLDTLKLSIKSNPIRTTLIAQITEDNAEELISTYEALDLKFVNGDWTHESILKRAGVQNARIVIAMPDESIQAPGLRDEKTILATLAVKALNPKVRIFVHISVPDNRIFLQRAQADEIFVADEFAGYILASRVAASGLPQAARDLFSIESPSRILISEIPQELIGKTFADAVTHFFRKGMLIIGLTREETPLEAADILSADTSALDEFIRRKFQEAGLNSAEKTRTKARINPGHDTVIDVRDKAFVIGQVS
jgi:voltage-gated potassium channel